MPDLIELAIPAFILLMTIEAIADAVLRRDNMIVMRRHDERGDRHARQQLTQFWQRAKQAMRCGERDPAIRLALIALARAPAIAHILAE